jgi:5-methylcytosine-specific restriction endonuclease McrA
VDAKPYPKAQQLSRGERRYRRKVASPKQWAAIRSAKLDGAKCRICVEPASELHHVVTRGALGDDVPDNLVPVCRECHRDLTGREPGIGAELLRLLSDAEYAYMIERGGEDYPERAYGVTYGR